MLHITTTVVKVGRYYPSNRTCSICGWKNDGHTLADRRWTCPQFGTKHDRDVNAVINTLGEGLLQTIGGNRRLHWRRVYKTYCGRQPSAKPEAHKSLVCW